MKGLIKISCYKCEERYIGCHGKCEKYKEFKKEIERRKKIEDVNRQWRIYSAERASKTLIHTIKKNNFYTYKYI